MVYRVMKEANQNDNNKKGYGNEGEVGDGAITSTEHDYITARGDLPLVTLHNEIPDRKQTPNRYRDCP